MIRCNRIVLNVKTCLQDTVEFNASVNQSKGCKYQESTQSSTTPNPGFQWESDKLTVRHHKREPRVSLFPAGDHKAYINRRTQRHSKHKTEKA